MTSPWKAGRSHHKNRSTASSTTSPGQYRRIRAAYVRPMSDVGDARSVSGDVEHDLANRQPLVYQPHRLGTSREREASADEWTYDTVGYQPLQRLLDLGVECGLGHDIAAPAGAHDLRVAKEQPVDLDLGDRPAREADDDQAAPLAQRAQAVEEAIASHGVEHDVDAAAGELQRLIAPRTVRTQDLVCARRTRRLLLFVARHDRH